MESSKRILNRCWWRDENAGLILHVRSFEIKLASLDLSLNVLLNLPLLYTAKITASSMNELGKRKQIADLQVAQ